MYKFKVSMKVHETSVESRISQTGTPTPEWGAATYFFAKNP